MFYWFRNKNIKSNSKVQKVCKDWGAPKMKQQKKICSKQQQMNKYAKQQKTLHTGCQKHKDISSQRDTVFLNTPLDLGLSAMLITFGIQPHNWSANFQKHIGDPKLL